MQKDEVEAISADILPSEGDGLDIDHDNTNATATGAINEEMVV